MSKEYEDGYREGFTDGRKEGFQEALRQVEQGFGVKITVRPNPNGLLIEDVAAWEKPGWQEGYDSGFQAAVEESNRKWDDSRL